MKQKLFKVRVSYEYVVLAEDYEDACNVAHKAHKNENAGEEPRFKPDDIYSLDDLPDGYNGSCIPWDKEDAPLPWGESDDSRTIQEILEGENDE